MHILKNSQLLNSPIKVQFKESLKQADNEIGKDDQFRDTRGDANRLHCKYISSDLTIYENFIILVKNDSRLIET